MLGHLRSRVVELLAPVHNALLSTFGPANIQAADVSCAARGLHLYVLLPRTSDLLFNIESHDDVVVSTVAWQVHGCARILEPDAWPYSLDLTQTDQARWQALVEVRPVRVQILGGPAGPETIDIDRTDFDGA